ncbi:aromatic amino acid ammonia-lyase [Inquilinus limosus]|uniref:aromatic amino acid lyase n=1 Tax=Inquilinus limosus TaxID=171674 RepID=UPI003F13F3F0
MTVVLSRRADITLDAVHRVAWRGEGVRIAETALRRIAECRAAFLRLIDTDPDLVIYGVTTAMGELADRRLQPEERERHARIKAFAAATAFGNPLPERVARGIVLARLANFLEGHAATTPRIALAVAAMLDGGPLPLVPASGQGGAGEILALYPLFAELSTRFDLEVKERGSLINGSPGAAALLADSALAARNRIRLAETVFALSIEAFRAPLEHYDPALEPLWGDAHEAAALRNLRALLDGAGDGRRSYQAPISYRIVPRLLGQAHRALAAAEQAATVSLAAVTDNPIYIPPDEAGPAYPNGRCLSTGGYHNAMAAPALDDLAAIWADLCLLCDRHSSKLLAGRVSHLPDLLMVDRDPADSDGHGSLGYVPMAVTGYLEQAKAAAQRTLLPGTEAAGAGQDDVAAPAFLAWAKEERAGRCLDAALAMLAVIASQALHVTSRAAPPPLRSLVDEVRGTVPPVEEDRVLGPELGRLAERLTQRVFSTEEP